DGSQFYIDNPELPFNSNGYTYNYNVDEAEIQGLEITTDYQVRDDVKYRHSYTYTDSEQKSGQHQGKPLSDIPKHMFNAGLDWELNDQVLLWSQLNYCGETAGTTGGVKTPSYTFVDVGAAYNHDDKLLFSTGIYNLASKNVVDDGNSSVLDGRKYSFAVNLKF